MPRLRTRCTTCASQCDRRGPIDDNHTTMVVRLARLLVGAGLVACHHAEAEPSTCATCHPAEAASWEGSRHAHAADNAAFVRSFADAKPGWCQDCHRAGGVSCAACHTADTPATDTCGACHEFDLPQDQGAGQHTVTEWSSSRAGTEGRGCERCHDPHAVSGAYDLEGLRARTSVAARRVGSAVVATITFDGVGHAVPTGDPFRRLEFQVFGDLAGARHLGSAELGLRFALDDDGAVRVIEDTRLPPPTAGDRAERTVTVDAPGARSWRLWFRRVDPDHEAEVVESVSLLKSGVLGGP